MTLLRYQESVGGWDGKGKKKCTEISGGVAFSGHYVSAQFLSCAVTWPTYFHCAKNSSRPPSLPLLHR